MNKFEAVLFDLDGTFADTSRDMCDALNIVLIEHKYEIVNCDDLKTHISRGAIGIIEYASLVNGRSIDSSLLRAEFLEEYSKNTFVHTKMIDGISDLISLINDQNIKWGIVTNKHSKYVNKILEGFSLRENLQCLITGDMLQQAKPDPEGLLMASQILKCELSKTVYVGDDERDIIAGKSAGMSTVAADFGFVNKDNDITMWGADNIITEPMMLKEILI